MNQLVLALQAALVLVIVLILKELLLLQRAVRSAQLLLPNLNEVRRMNETIRTGCARAEKANQALTESLDRLRLEPAHQESPRESETESGSAIAFTAEPESERPFSEAQPKRGPRVLSEAGRAKFDRVLQLAARGLDIDSIASEVDLTRAEIELMLGSVT